MDQAPPAGRGGVGAAFKRFLLLPVLAAAALGLFVIVFGLASDSPNFHGHAAGHWTMAIPVVFVALVVSRLPEARTTPRRITRLFLAIVLLALAAALLLEGIGAFGSTAKGPLESLLETLHRIGEAMTLFSIFALPLAGVFLAVTYGLAAMRVLVGLRRTRPRV
ncbi:MAG TPA: hypothetical protein VG408_06455 [Actinomycetota bacterium]|nr:hypothetical protein [Actinomycetota bacterium]